MNRCLLCGKTLQCTNEITHCTECQRIIEGTLYYKGTYEEIFNMPKVTSVTYNEDGIIYITLDNGKTYHLVGEENA